MTAKITAEFIKAIPKTDLHLHLDGSLRLPTLIELGKEAGLKLPSFDEEGLRELVFKEQYKDLPDYLQGFGYTCAVMQTEENLERIAYELAQDNMAENVRYFEVRFAPQLHVREDFTMEQIVSAIARGMDKAKAEHNASAAVQEGNDIPFEYGIIVCAMRCFYEFMSPYYADLCRVMKHAPKKELFAVASLELAHAAEDMAHHKGLPVVGFDLAGEESGYPAIYHRDAYQYCASHFIKKTVHAGEAYGPESIFQAITECYANRIGHGTFLFAVDMIKDPAIVDPNAFVKLLVEYIASQRIAIEVCPTSNLQTIPAMKDIANHPLRTMLDHNLSVCICTDNRLVSSTTVTDELMKVIDSLQVTPRELRNLVLAGFKGSFYPGSYNAKRAYVRKAIDRFEKLAADFGLDK
ncbi:MAG: adenosine deaminase family protein [Spartobacteria bacterium]|nr:adenosine deaminase family protein [Spartobacteria bacterium]